jgi:two-component system sensor histidine kinase KdpD
MELTAELVTLVDEESLHLDQLIGGLVELARIESGKLLLTTTWSSLRDVTNAAIQRATNALKEHHVVVEMQETLPLLHIDARALSEVIYTLLDNARKYSPVGSVITIRAEAKNEVIEVSVHDEGVGIREGDAERVFDKFYRVEDVRSNAPGGLGIGLSIAKAIVEAHRGAICVAPDRGGKGTALVFRIPVQREA